jgi:hypothetical protein
VVVAGGSRKAPRSILRQGSSFMLLRTDPTLAQRSCECWRSSARRLPERALEALAGDQTQYMRSYMIRVPVWRAASPVGPARKQKQALAHDDQLRPGFSIR